MKNRWTKRFRLPFSEKKVLQCLSLDSKTVLMLCGNFPIMLLLLFGYFILNKDKYVQCCYKVMQKILLNAFHNAYFL